MGKKKFTKEDLMNGIDISGWKPRHVDYAVDYINNFFKKPSERKTRRALAKDNGFTDSYIPSRVLKAAGPVVKKMMTQRLKALDEMDEKIDDAKYRDLTLAVERLSRSINDTVETAHEQEREDKGVKLTEGQYERLIKLEAQRRGWTPPEEGDYVEKSGEVADRLLGGGGQALQSELAPQGDSGSSGEESGEGDEGGEGKSNS